MFASGNAMDTSALGGVYVGDQVNNKYCPKCGTLKKKDKRYYFWKGFTTALKVVVTVLCVYGAMFMYMTVTNPFYVVVPFVSVANFQYTEQASQFHPEVQEVADRILDECHDEQHFYQECLIDEARSYMIDNFEYENDWEYGHSNGGKTDNMIVSMRKKGDCIDFSVTFCSIMKHVGISCIVRSPNGAHRIALVKLDGHKWHIIEPQNLAQTGWFDDDTFQGFLI